MRASGWTLNGIGSFLRSCLQATPPYKRNLSGRFTPLLPETELSGGLVSFNKCQQNEEGYFQKH